MPESAETVKEVNATTGTEAGSDGAGSEGRKSDDQEMVPLARLNQVISTNHRLETEIARTQGRVDALLEQGSKGGGDKEHSASELRRMIEEEEITQGQADDIIQNQTNDRITKRVDEEVHERVTAAANKSKIDGEISRYIEAQPDAASEGSDIHTKVSTEYRYLLGIGHEDNTATQLSALRAALGPVERLNMTPPGKGERETHQESTGSGGEGEGRSEESGAWPKGMNKGHRDYYTDLINKGIVSDRKAAIDEFNYKPKHGARR